MISVWSGPVIQETMLWAVTDPSIKMKQSLISLSEQNQMLDLDLVSDKQIYIKQIKNIVDLSHMQTID